MFVSQGLAVICNNCMPPPYVINVWPRHAVCVDHRRISSESGGENIGPVATPRSPGNTWVGETMSDINYLSIYKYCNDLVNDKGSFSFCITSFRTRER